jgi:hypothetical protein
MGSPLGDRPTFLGSITVRISPYHACPIGEAGSQSAQEVRAAYMRA